MARMSANEKAKLYSLARRGDFVAKKLLDLTDSIVEITEGGEGPLLIVRCATAANHGLSGLTAVDGVTPVAGDLVLVKNHVTGSSKGIYVAAASTWARYKNSEGKDVLEPGMQVVVAEGDTLADTIWMLTTNAPFTTGTTSQTWAQVLGSGVSSADLASVVNAKGASLVGVEDALALLAAADAEAALAELAKYQCINLADPGTGAAIPVTRSAYVGIVTAAAETNTLAIPTFLGQRLILNMDTRVGGDRVVTCAQSLNQAGNTIMTFGAARDCIVLEAIKVGGAFRWQVVSNDGVALS
jgi:hypothetical protein